MQFFGRSISFLEYTYACYFNSFILSHICYESFHECRDVHSIIRQNGLINYDHYWYKFGKKEDLGDCGMCGICVCVIEQSIILKMYLYANIELYLVQ